MPVKAKVLKINLNKLSKSYNLKGVTEVQIVGADNIADVNDLITSVSGSGNNLVLTTTNAKTPKITLTNANDYATTPLTIGEIPYTLNDILSAHIDAIPTITVPTKGTTVTGSFLNETIDLTTFRLKDKQGNDILDTNKKGLTIDGGIGNDTITGSIYKDTTKGGDGDDTVYASKGDDTITGGKGVTTLKYDTIIENFGNDTVNLTKDEIVNINTSYSLSGTPVLMQGKNKNDLLIKTNQGNITVKNYLGKNDIATVTLNGDDIKDKTMSEVNAANYFELNPKKMNTKYTGTKLSDVVDAHSLSKAANAKTNLGVTIDGGAGDDTLIGSDFNDTIKAGTGLTESIKGGQGKDTLYASTTVNSNTTFIFSKGDGNDIVNGGKGQDTLEFTNVALDDIQFAKNKNDLVISYNYEEEVAQDSVTVKNYFNKKGQAISSVKYITIGGKTFDLETFRDYVERGSIIVATESPTNGTDNDDIIFASGGAGQTIKAGKGNDIIYASTDMHDGYYWGEAGNDTLYASDNYTEQALYGGDGDDVLYGSNYNGNDVNVGQCRLNPGLGNNIVYAGEYCAKYINLNYDGGTTVYTSSGENNAIGQNASNRIFLTSHGQLRTKANDILYWRGSNNVSLEMTYWDSDKIFATRETGSDDLVLRYASDASMTIKDYFKEGNEGIATAISLKTHDYGDINIGSYLENQGGAMTKIEGLTGTENTDFIEGTEGADTITGGAGNDVIRPLGGDDTIYLGSGNDYLFSGTGNKTVYADSGNNTIYFGNGVSTLYAGTGEDVVYNGFAGSSNSTSAVTIEFRADDTGNDSLRLAGNNKNLIFKGDTLNDLSMSLINDIYTPVITRASNGKTVTLTGNSTKAVEDTTVTITDKNGATSSLKNLNTETGILNYNYNQILTTYDGNDTINTGKATDNINAGLGTNTINLVKVATGNNNNYTYANGTDTFILPDAIENFDDFTMLKKGNDLTIGFNGDLANNTVKIKDYFNNEAMKNNISFRAGEVTKTLNTLLDEKGYNEIINCDGENHNMDYSASPKAVSVVGCAESDTITGSAYSDNLNGKGGADTLIGGAGDDTYVIDSANYGDGLDVISDTSGDNDKLLLGAAINTNVNSSDSEINLFFEVNKTGTLTDGNANYTTGNDLYIIKDRDYTFDNVTTSGGVKIENYFTTGRIENLRNADDTKDIVKPMVINAIGQTVANWLYNNGFESTSDVITNGTNEQKAALLKLYKPFVSIFGNKSGTSDSDFIILTEATYPYPLSSQSVYGNGGNDILYASNYSGDDYLSGGDGDDVIYGSNYEGGGQTLIDTGSGNNIVHAGDNCTHYIQLGDGDDTVYTTQTKQTQIWVDKYADGYNGGNDTIHWRGTQALSVKFFDYNQMELAFTRDGESDDLVIRYGDDNSVTMKDYYKAGNEELANQSVDYMQNRGGSYFNTVISYYQNGVMDYTETNATIYDGTNENNYIVAGENCAGINASGGSDYIVSSGYSAIYTNINHPTLGKDTNPNTYDNVRLIGGNYHAVFAQSQFNIINSTTASREDYHAYIDQTTYINDKGGNNDCLYIENTPEMTDGNRANLKVLFDVSANYTYDGTAETLFDGDVLITDTATKANFNRYMDRIAYGYSGVYIEDNQIEYISSSDNYCLTKEDISTLAGEVAGWLTAHDYADVSAVFASNNETDINALIAQFNNANWTYTE